MQRAHCLIVSCLKVARIRNNIHDPLEEDKRTSDYHRLATAEAQPEADAFCICQVPIATFSIERTKSGTALTAVPLLFAYRRPSFTPEVSRR